MDNKPAIFFAAALAAAGAEAVVFAKPAAAPAAVRHAAAVQPYEWNRFASFRTEFRHVPLSCPYDPFHETYRKNLGEQPSKSGASSAKNKLSDIDRRIQDLERQLSDLLAKMAASESPPERKSPISFYSNVTAPDPAPRQINIQNSSVTIYAD